MGTGNLYKDRYDLFCVEAMLGESAFPQIHKIRSIFADISLEDFILFADRVFSCEDSEVTQQFVYFVMLFRDMDHIQRYINSEEFTIDKLERFVMFTFGYCSMYDLSIGKVLDDILFFLDNRKLLDLALNSSFVNNDKLMLFMILTKFDTHTLDKYFSKIRDTAKIINFFVRLPDNVLRAIISRNYHLFQYIILMMAEVDAGVEITSDFINRYSFDLQQFGRLSDILKTYKESADLEQEKKLPFDKRDMKRLSLLISMVREMPDPVKVIEYFSGERVFIDDMEKSFVMAAVSDPMLKHIFKNRDLTRTA